MLVSSLAYTSTVIIYLYKMAAAICNHCVNSSNISRDMKLIIGKTLTLH
jgi:hypothetical protein